MYLVPKDPGRNTPATNPSGSDIQHVVRHRSHSARFDLGQLVADHTDGRCAVVTACNTTVSTNVFIPTAGMCWITVVDSS